MKMIILNQFCCGCSIRTGSLIIGLVDAIAGIYFVVAGCLKAPEAESALFREVLYVDILPNIILAIASIILVYGVIKDVAKCLLPWMIFYAIYILFCIFSMFVLIFYFLTTQGERVYGIELLFLIILAIPLCFYFFLVVNSHYRNLTDGVQVVPLPPIVMFV